MIVYSFLASHPNIKVQSQNKSCTNNVMMEKNPKNVIKLKFSRFCMLYMGLGKNGAPPRWVLRLRWALRIIILMNNVTEDKNMHKRISF